MTTRSIDVNVRPNSPTHVRVIGYHFPCTTVRRNLSPPAEPL
jgi:hypothetical protein